LLSAQWRDAVAAAEVAATGVAAGLTELPDAIAGVQPEMRETLQALVASLREAIPTAATLDFAAIEESATAVADTVVPVAGPLGEVWLDRELV